MGIPMAPMNLHEQIVPFHRDLTFDFNLGALTLPHALQSYTSQSDAPNTINPSWDDVEDRRALDDYTAKELAKTLGQLYEGPSGAPTRRAMILSDSYPNSQVPRWKIASQLPSPRDGIVRPCLALVVNQFGAVVAPDASGHMVLGAITFIADAPTLYQRYRLNPLQDGIDALFARLAEDVYSIKGKVVTRADNERGEYKVEIYPKEVAGDPAGTMIARVRRANATWLQAMALGDGRVVVQSSHQPLTKDSLSRAVFSWQIILPSPRRDTEGRVTERLPNRSSPFWRGLEKFAKTADLLKQEERLIKSGACDLN